MQNESCILILGDSNHRYGFRIAACSCMLLAFALKDRDTLETWDEGLKLPFYCCNKGRSAWVFAGMKLFLR